MRPDYSSRVCHISTVHPTFDQRIFHRACWSLHRAGYETHLIVQHDQDNAVVDGIHIHAVDQTQKNRPGMRILQRIRRIWRALRLASQLKADVYHLHDAELIPLGLWLKLRTKARVIFDCHENNVAYIKQKTYLPAWIRNTLIPLMTITEWLAARFFDAIVTADQGVAEIFAQRYRARRVQVIHNFPRLDLFLEHTQSENGPSPTFDLVYHGTIPKYHLEVAFAIASELQQRGRQVSWLFFGNGPSTEWVHDQLEQRGLQNNFTYDPHRIPHEEVAERVRQSRIGFIPLPDLPKFQHNIPTKLFEYMALEMPVILSDLPPSRPFVGDGAAAIMVKADDYPAYADAIIKLLDDEDLRTQMGKIGRERVIEQYNWDTESKHLIELYEALGIH